MTREPVERDVARAMEEGYPTAKKRKGGERGQTSLLVETRIGGQSRLRSERQRARKAEWQALQARRSLLLIAATVDSPLPQWEILD
jgi:hypothetical protein